MGFVWVTGDDESEPQLQQHVLAVLTCQGQLSLMKSFDDLNPYIIQTELQSPIVEWNNEGEFICVAGHLTHRLVASDSSSSSSTSNLFANCLHFFNNRGILRYRISVPYTQVLFYSINISTSLFLSVCLSVCLFLYLVSPFYLGFSTPKHCQIYRL